MQAKDAAEAAPLLQRTLATLVGQAPTSGRPGADLRTACGNLSANAEVLLRADAAGPPLVNCFDLAQKTGVTQPQLAVVRNKALAENPVTLGANLLRDELVQTCLTYEALAIAGMTFTSRQDVEALLVEVNAVYAGVEETVADAMDQASYRALVALHAAVNFFLVTALRPLPRMVRFVFYKSQPTLVASMKLYSRADRADQLLAENKVVHPAFMRPTGQALSS